MYNLIKQNATRNGVNSLQRCYSVKQKCHYDILKLRKSCTDKEIKEAFIKLSKEYHPDKNKSSNAQEHFVRIVEAYNVLGKPSTRAQYDRTSSFIDHTPPFYRSPSNVHNTRQNQSSYGHTYYDFAAHARASNFHNFDQASRKTYGKGMPLRRIPNYVLVLLCFGVAFVGTVLQIVVIRFEESAWKKVQRNREMYVVHKRRTLETSKFLSEEYDKVREAAQGNSNETQTRLLLEKIVGSANPTIATASLGQALAAEKK